MIERITSGHATREEGGNATHMATNADDGAPVCGTTVFGGLVGGFYYVDPIDPDTFEAQPTAYVDCGRCLRIWDARVRTEKQCTGPCGRVLPLSHFHRRGTRGGRSTADGRRSKCRGCHATHVAETRDPEKQRARNREYMRRVRQHGG